VATAVLVSHLMAVTWIDARKMIIPNALNLSLAVCGFGVALLVLHLSWLTVLIQCVAAYAGFSLIAWAYVQLRGRAGFGEGDIKLFAAATAWVGLVAMPWLILIASISGLIFVLATQIVRGGVVFNQRLAFGPHLSLGLFVTWLSRDTLMAIGT